jgi:hypothetical protein
MVGRQLDLDDVRAQQRGDLRGIGGDVDRRLAVLRHALAARVGPDHRGDALGRGLLAHGADLLEHLQRAIRAGIDGEADRRAAQPERVVDAGGDGLVLAGAARHQRIGAVGLEDGGDLPGEGVGAGLDHAQGCGDRR